MTAFGSEYTIGVEEELLLVDAGTGALEPASGEVLDRLEVGRAIVDFELYAAQLELRSGSCADAGTVLDRLEHARAAVTAAGATVIGCGVHPTGRFGDAHIVDSERYRAVHAMFRGLMDRTPEAALHVHVGLPDEAAAVRALNGLREYLPIFIALAANSPWWFGHDAGLSSARYSLVRAYPTRRVPDPVSSYEQYLRATETICADVGLGDPTFIYWDLRLHPRYGTVELREMDAQCSPAVSAGLAALIQATTAALADGALCPPPSPQDSLTWACFLASRDGLAARRVGRPADDGTVAEDCRALLDAVRPVSRSLGSDAALQVIERLLRDGNGADRQRDAVRRGGRDALLRYLIDASNRPGPNPL